jgi:signal transduction histidine kinase
MNRELSVLVVDDNKDNLEMLQYLLKNNNYDVHTALNGEEALNKLNDKDFDLIISDILMPVMDGFQLCRECKKSEKLKNICFIFYTATYVDSKDEEFALSLGAQKFLRKPQDPEILLKQINETYNAFSNSQNKTQVPNTKDDKEIYKLYSERLVAKLEKKNLDLEKEIEEHRKTMEQLVRAKQKAEESDKLKTAFLTNMSHEIRTPMNGIMGFTNLLKSKDLSEKDKEKYINIIQLSSKRLLGLINDLIDISQIETGQVSVKVSEFYVNEVIEQIFSYFSTEIQRKGLELVIESELGKNTTRLKTDRFKVETILLNLIKNAIKYSEEGTIYLKIKQVDNSIEFLVQDSGIGISESRLDAIFKPFVQADIEDSMAYQGAGLGLSIAKSYAEMLEGNIKVESEEGKGSTFCFTLPLELSKNKKQDLEAGMVQKNSDNKKNLKILIVEDDVNSDMFLTVLLEDISSEILHARTGKEALEICLNHKDIDLILLDLKMPEMNGYDALIKIREFNKDSVIIAQTAYGVVGDREKLTNMGCNDYIMKPINEKELTDTIEKHIYS